MAEAIAHIPLGKGATKMQFERLAAVEFASTTQAGRVSVRVLVVRGDKDSDQILTEAKDMAATLLKAAALA